ERASRAPRAASSPASARPIPDPAPVITATLSWNCFTVVPHPSVGGHGVAGAPTVVLVECVGVSRSDTSHGGAATTVRCMGQLHNQRYLSTCSTSIVRPHDRIPQTVGIRIPW